MQSEVVKHKKTMKDIEKSINDIKDSDRNKLIKNKEQINKIYELCQEINGLNTFYENSVEKFYFDYDGVVELLDKTKERIETSLRCSRPKYLPDDIVWCEKDNSNDEFDPFVFDGTISLEDFKRLQVSTLKDLKKLSSDL